MFLESWLFTTLKNAQFFSCSKCAENHVRKASPGKTGTEQGGRKGKLARCDSSDEKRKRKGENFQQPRESVKKTKTQADIRHVFSDPAHGSRVRLSAASLTNPFQAPILRQEVDQVELDQMQTDERSQHSEKGVYDGTSSDDVEKAPSASLLDCSQVIRIPAGIDDSINNSSRISSPNGH